MSNAITHPFHLRRNAAGAHKAVARASAGHFASDPLSKQQFLGLLLILAAICVPVALTCAIALALKLLA